MIPPLRPADLGTLTAIRLLRAGRTAHGTFPALPSQRSTIRTYHVQTDAVPEHPHVTEGVAPMP